MSRGRKRAWRSRHKVQLGPIWIVVLLILLLAALLFTGAVMLGSHLRRQAEQIGDDSSVSEITTPDFDSSNVPSVIARPAVFGQTPEPLGKIPPVPETTAPAPETTPGDTAVIPTETTPVPQAENTENSTETTAAQPTTETSSAPLEAVSKDYNAYCVIMRGKDGVLRYRSPLREYLLGAAPDASLPELATGVAEFNGAYLSGIFHAEYPTSAENMRKSARQYDIMLAAELADSGFNDIVVTGLSFDSDAADFCAAVKEKTSADCRIGVAVSYEFLTSAEARESLVRLGGAFDFIALDLGGIEATENFGKADILSSNLYAIRALVGIYHIRVLIPNEAGLAAVALDAGAENLAEIITETTAPEVTTG